MGKIYDHKLVEREVEELWKKEKNKIEESMKYDPKKKLFSFLEGPPTANAPPGFHHAESRFLKDAYPRYKYMKGFTVPRRGGWDCHGLPVEVQVEKKLKLGTKKDVLKYGVDKFAQVCRQDVFTFIKEWTMFSKKLAQWLDLKNPYITMTNDYVESVWWSLKELYKKKLLYEDHKVVPFCPRCETPLSSHEVAQGYEDVTEVSITTKFRIKGTNRFLLGWTTTPWTCPGNVALAVNPDLVYVVVEKNGEEYILTKNRVSHYFEDAKIVEEFKGKKLDGIEYEPLFDFFVEKVEKPAWKVVMVDYATDEEGTGIIHTAPAFGEEDYETVKKYNMAFIQHVTKDGLFTEDTKNMGGLTVWEANKKVIDDLDKRGLLFNKENYTHSYPHCWRCRTPLLYYATKSWFIAVTKYKNKLLKNNELINWYPDHIKHGRFGDWLENVKDWALSRDKFWGTPLPIWRCECGNEECIGSVEELKKRSTKELKDFDLHRPWIDNVKLKCKCGKEMTRVTPVIDCWYDSGSATFAQFHYPFENKELFEKRFPYDFIAEAIDQTRGWFYTLHAIATLIFDKPAYRNVVCAGHILDEKGEKMSKSKGNIIDPWKMFDKFGADAVRMSMCLTHPGNSKRMGENTLKENVMPFFNTLWNVQLFIRNLKSKDGKEKIEDRWLKSRANTLIEEFEKNLNNHDYHICFELLKEFVIEDVSRWYIKLGRERVLENDKSFKETLLYAFGVLSKILAPITPYLADYLYTDLLGNEESVHFSSWPDPDKKMMSKALEKQMEIIKDIVSTSSAFRKEKDIKLKYALPSLSISGSDEIIQSVESLKDILLKMANVKEVKRSDDIKIDYDVKLNYRIAGRDFGKDIKEIENKLGDANKLKKELENKGKIRIGKFELKPSHLIFKEKAGTIGKEFKGGKLILETEVTPELKKEWLVRELIREVQGKRKEMRLNPEDRIKLCLSDERAFKGSEDIIKKITGSEITFGKFEGEKVEFDFENKKYVFGVKK